jgi:hypothetical protein
MFVIKNTMLAIALVIGISGAFATKVANSPKLDEPRYDWYGSGQFHSGTLDDKTPMEAQNYYGCYGDAVQCISGSLSSGQGSPRVVIFKD